MKTTATPKKAEAIRKGGHRYIRTRKKVFRYTSTAAAEASIQRLRRTDATAAIVPLDEEFELLRTTPAANVIEVKG